MTVDPRIDREARRLLRSARRRDRLVPVAIGVAGLYVMSTCWGFLRPLGDGSGEPIRVQASSTLWGVGGIAAVVLVAKAAGRIAEDAGVSPFAPARWARRLLLAAAFALLLLLAGVEPTVAVMTVDSGSLSVPAPHWLVTVAATPLH